MMMMHNCWKLLLRAKNYLIENKIYNFKKLNNTNNKHFKIKPNLNLSKFNKILHKIQKIFIMKIKFKLKI